MTEKLPALINACFIEEISINFAFACTKKCSDTDQCKLACYKGNNLLVFVTKSIFWVFATKVIFY